MAAVLLRRRGGEVRDSCGPGHVWARGDVNEEHGRKELENSSRV